MAPELEGRVAIVTGGARGIGAAIARCLAEGGARIGVIDLSGEVAAETCRELPGEAMSVVADASQEDAMSAAVAEVVERFGRLDVMVNNAGAAAGEIDLADMATLGGSAGVPPITNLTQESWDQTVANNLRTTFVGSKAAIPHLEAAGGGSIVNIASIAGLRPSPNLPAYGAAKAAVIHLTRTLAVELAPKDIRVNVICPGLLYTRAWEMLATSMKSSIPELAERTPREIFQYVVEMQTPLGREQTPEDIGRLTAFLVSDAARNITGQDVSVDGGITLAGGLSTLGARR